MFDFTERTERLIGKDQVEKLERAAVLIFGLGGVGSYCAEALCRAGIGRFTLVDADTVSLSNLNRQLYALRSTLGQQKTEAAKARMLDINPAVQVTCRSLFYTEECESELDFSDFDFIVDAVDSVGAKIAIIRRAAACGIPVISCMGAGNRLDACGFTVTELEKTQGDPLARILRKKMREYDIRHVPVVCSNAPVIPDRPGSGEKQIASISFVPAVAGLYAAAYVTEQLLAKQAGAEGGGTP